MKKPGCRFDTAKPDRRQVESACAGRRTPRTVTRVSTSAPSTSAAHTAVYDALRTASSSASSSSWCKLYACPSGQARATRSREVDLPPADVRWRRDWQLARAREVDVARELVRNARGPSLENCAGRRGGEGGRPKSLAELVLRCARPRRPHFAACPENRRSGERCAKCSAPGRAGFPEPRRSMAHLLSSDSEPLPSCSRCAAEVLSSSSGWTDGGRRLERASTTLSSTRPSAKEARAYSWGRKTVLRAGRGQSWEKPATGDEVSVEWAKSATPRMSPTRWRRRRSRSASAFPTACARASRR